MVNLFKKKKVFGLPLEQAIKASPILNGLPFPLTRCVDAVERYALHEEGIYRRAGAKNSIEALVKVYDTGKDPELQSQDPYTVCCVVKEYLKKLPDPLTSYELYGDFMDLGRTRKNKTREESAESMKALVEKLPESSRYVLYFVVKHLQAVAQHHDENKMSITNLSIVFGPNLFRSTNPSPTVMLGDVSHQGYCVDLLIRESDIIFGSIGVNNKQIAVSDDPLAVTTAHTPSTSDKSRRPSDADNAGNRSSRRFGSHGQDNKRKGLSLIELKLSEESTGRGLFRPESTRIVFNEDNKSKQVTYTTDDIAQLVKDIVNETLEESAHKSFKRSLSDGSVMLRSPKRAAWKSEEPEDLQSTTNNQRRSSAVEEYTKDLDHASDITNNTNEDELNTQNQANSKSHKNIPPLTEETLKQLESIQIDIHNPLESMTQRVSIRRNNYTETILHGLDVSKIDEKWNPQQLYLEKTILRDEIKYFEELYGKKKSSAPSKEVKESLRPIYERYSQARDLHELFESNNHAFSSQMSMESPLHQVVVYRTNSYSVNSNNRLSNNPYLDGRRSISFCLRGKSSQSKTPEFKQLLLKNKQYAEMKARKKELQKILLEFEKKFKDEHKRKMKYKSEWSNQEKVFDEYKNLKQKMNEFVLNISKNSSLHNVGEE